MTMGGAARFQTANLLAACAALRARNVSAEVVATAAASFSACEDNAGRANLYRVAEGYVMLDYGHNPAGFAQVCQLAGRWMRSGRRCETGWPITSSSVTTSSLTWDSCARRGWGSATGAWIP